MISNWGIPDLKGKEIINLKSINTLRYGVINPLSRLMEVQRVSTMFRGVHSMKGRLLELHDITLCLASRAVFGVRCNWSLGANLERQR